MFISNNIVNDRGSFNGFPKNGNLKPIGKVIENDWTVSASGWTKAQPSSTIGLTGSSITFTGGGTGTTGNYAQWNGFTYGSSKVDFEIDYLITTIGAGLYLEFKSTSGTSNNNNTVRYYFNLTNLGAVMYNYNGAVALTTTTQFSPAGFTVANGDTVRMKLSIDEYTSTMKTYIVGREQYVNTASFTTTYSPPYPYRVYMNNHYKVRIGTFGGTFTANNWKVTLNNKIGVTNLYCVDSLGKGLGCSSKYTTYPYMIGNINGSSFEVLGGPSARLAYMNSDYTEITMIKAKNVFNAIGINDLVAGTAIATIKANCVAMKNAAEAVGSRFYQLGIMPNNSTDPSALNELLRTTFKEKFIDINSSLRGSSFNLSNTFGVPLDPLPHLNDGGHNQIKNILLKYAF